MDADELYQFLKKHATWENGRLVSRVSIIEELRRRGADNCQAKRVSLVKELTKRGALYRPHPRSRVLILTDPIAHSPSMTRSRIIKLREYMTSNVLQDDFFVCASERECKTSIPKGCTFTEGQLSHVGRHYDLTIRARPMRVVVVGQEVGSQGLRHITLEERYASLVWSAHKRRFVTKGKRKGRNPHMRGTTLALRVAFGLDVATDHKGEYLTIDGEPVHIFDCFALVNRLLCASHVKGTSNGKPSQTMLDNCERHFRSTIEILEPTIVIIQGLKVWQNSRRVFGRVRKLEDHLFEGEINGKDAMLCTFTHPSAWGSQRWDSPSGAYFQTIVEPTLRRAVNSIARR